MYLTTPIFYANDLPHIGHAYATLAADTIARYHRLQGQEVFLVTGTDEHGINIERIATRQNITPQQHVDRIAATFQDLWPILDVTPNRFVRTTEPAHTRSALELWRRLQASGDLYRGTYEGAYCPRCEAYYQSNELTHGGCPIHGLPCEDVREENWFFRLSRYQQTLEHLVGETDFVQPATARNELLGVLREGLRDFSTTRANVRWGIPVPESPGEVIYVWVEALASYLTGIGFPDDQTHFARYWPSAVHLIGKEILRFHGLYWPALLLSAGLPVPTRIFAHGWLTREGRKISKSTGNGIDPLQLVEHYGADAVRYYFLRTVPFGQDGDYTAASFLGTYNADLANDFGNLVQRATTLFARYGSAQPASAPSRPEYLLRQAADQLTAAVSEAFDRFALHEAARSISAFVREANRYIDTTAPWDLVKRNDGARVACVLSHLLEAARVAAWYYTPFLPRAATEAHRRI
ncbi:MAG: methionine--tRNA ligase, partial [Chloroflexi bacterium]|nr:methionine--tRNA ligase [Chloroflexota bacterium]